jgi:hypothetical protein
VQEGRVQEDRTGVGGQKGGVRPSPAPQLGQMCSTDRGQEELNVPGEGTGIQRRYSYVDTILPPQRKHIQKRSS